VYFLCIIYKFSNTFYLTIYPADTANLASFLVSPRVTLYKYPTVASVLQRDGKVCVQANTILQEILQEKYPSLPVVPKETEQGVFDGVRQDISSGGCNAFAHQYNGVEIYERSQEVNYDCSISSEKRVVQIINAGMATAIDTGRYRCTSLITHVLDYYLALMQDDGFIKDAWKTHKSKLSTIECIQEVKNGRREGLEDTFRLTLQDVGGIFILHLCLTAFAMSLAFFQFFRRKDGRTLSSAFGVTQAKQAIGRRLSATTNRRFSATSSSSPTT